MRKRKNNLPRFVQPYRNGEYRVCISRRDLKYAKYGFATPEAAHQHALSVIEQRTGKAYVTGERAGRIKVPETRPTEYECQACGYSCPDKLSQCSKCGSDNLARIDNNLDVDALIEKHFPGINKTPILAAAAPSCGNCIHAAVCRLKHDHESGMLEILRQLYAKADASLVRQIMGFYCDHYREKGS